MDKTGTKPIRTEQGKNRDNNGQIIRLKTGTSPAGTKQNQSGIIGDICLPAISVLSLLSLFCPWLSLFCPCLSLFCPCLSLFGPGHYGHNWSTAQTKLFRFSESLGKSNEQKWSQIWKLLHKGCKIAAAKKSLRISLICSLRLIPCLPTFPKVQCPNF